jgi:hypothetical protein
MTLVSKRLARLLALMSSTQRAEYETTLRTSDDAHDMVYRLSVAERILARQ